MAKNKKKKNIPNYLEEYVVLINSGKVPVCKKTMTIYNRVYNESKTNGSKYVFDPAAGNRPIEFIETFCKQSKGVLGAPIRLDLWQKAYIQTVYGFINPVTGFRRFREALLIVGRKNGKSTMLSGLGLFALVGDREGSPEVDCVATKKDQAKIVFTEACNMASQSPDILKMLKRRKTDLYCKYNYGVIQPLSSDSDTLDGLNTHMGIIDELHAIKDRNLYDVIVQGMSSRNQPLLFEITTAPSKDKPGSIYESQYEYASKVISGEVVDDTFFPVIYELDDVEEWTDPKAWMKANPGLGTIKKIEALKQNVEKAKNDQSFKATVLQKDFNVKTTGSASWLSWEDLWNPATFDTADVYDCYGIGGCDLSATTDLTCSTMLVKRPHDPMIYVLQHYFIPEKRVKVIEGMSSQEAPYRKWEERGLLTICEGARVNYSQVTEWFAKVRDELQITMVWCGYDRALAGYWAEEMADEFGQSVMEKIAQGPFTWTSPMKELGALLMDKQVNYNANPMLAWCLSNTAVKKSGSLDSIQPVKVSSNRRIDGFVSLLNAYTCYLKHKADFDNLVG